MIISASTDYRAAAQRRLPPFLFHYIDGGAYAEHTLKRNVTDLADIALRGEMGVSPAQRLPLLTVAGSADGAAFLRDYYPRPIRVEPLANFPVERDLVIVLDDFMGNIEGARAAGMQVIHVGDPRKALEQLEAMLQA